ncbi:cell division protein FtsL [Nitrosomonas sp.]|uniref:cell division protein FtsL n=1 Tax=Nitrosomonas sp. TaxID=42353 RepID=UPI00262D698B|nr:cell division protein FtsL [Nitrosomonas sp.]MCW5597870.1 cell division protein FtsL [Nitrosomonas sp.]MCW5601918.1 cell division protein FtsL [Nitrosomonas sp.]
MVKLNIFLIMILVVCGLGIVTSQHEARKLFMALEKEQELTDQLGIEWNQLLLEQRTWAMHGHVEKIAREQLNMVVPSPQSIHIILPASSAESEYPLELR